MNKLQIILGLGHTGLSCLRYLKEQGYTSIIVCDTRDNPPNLAILKKEFPDVSFNSGSLSKELLLQASRIIISPGLSLHEPAIAAAIQKGIPVIGDVELFAQVIGDTVPIIAITGTNAKGTVTTLVGLMAEEAGLKVDLGGNIGTPVLDLLSKPRPDLYVLELSSFQLESTFSLHAKAAIILNISPDHLDHHRDMEEYSAAKQRVYRGAQTIVYNRADEATKQLSSESQACPSSALWAPSLTSGRRILSESFPNEIYSFALDSTLAAHDFGTQEINDELWLMQGSTPLLKANALKIVGSHNIENALAALALARSMDLPMEVCLKAICAFKGLPHRCQLVREHKGVRWYNDSKATNIGSTMAALKGFAAHPHRNLILIAGGDAKGADVSLLRDLIKEQVDLVLVYGKDERLLIQAWRSVVNIKWVKDLADAVKEASHLAQEGDVVLLSPACSSLDMFKNFEERGEIFERLVSELGDMSTSSRA